MKQFLRMKRAVGFRLKKYFLRYIFCVACMLGYTAASLVYPNIISLIIDRGIAESNLELITKYSIQLLLVGILMILFRYMQKISFTKLSQGIVVEIQKKVMHMLTKVSYQFWQKHKPGDVLTVLESDIGKIENLVTTLISDSLVNLLVAISVAIYLIYVDWIIGGILIGLTFIFAVFQRIVGNKVKDGMTKLRKTQGNLSAYTNDAINHLPVIQLSDLGNSTLHKYNQKIDDYKNKYIIQITKMAMAQNISMLFNILSFFVVLFIGSYKVYSGSITIGILFSLTMYVQRLYSPIINLGNTYVSLKNISPILDKILDILENDDKVIEGTLEFVPQNNTAIQFNDVYFKYKETERYVLKNLSFRFNSNDIIGIVGKNGTGKTTLIRLLGKLCVPEKGEIIINEKNIDQYQANSLWNQISIMPQDIYIPQGKVEEILNISKQNRAYIEQVLKKLCFNNDILSEFLKTEVGMGNIPLSGGEKQKLAFVRVISRNRRICILDEPTSSLDLRSEEEMLEIIKENSDNKIIIIITHRPKLLELCNKIIKLE